MAESAISSALSTLGNLAIAEAKFLIGVADQVKSIKLELEFMQKFVRDAESKRHKGDNNESILVREIRDAAYEVDNVVAKINWMHKWNSQKKGVLGAILRYASVSPRDLIILHDVGKKIEEIKKKIQEIFQLKDRYDPTKLGETSVDNDGVDLSMEGDLNMQRFVSPYFESKSFVVGFDDEIEKIIIELTNSLNKDLTFVSLVGMGGIGKSTLASKVFNDPKIQDSFNTFAWISVSQSYKPIELLKDIMKKTMNIKKENLRNEERKENEITEQELENMPIEEVKKKLHDFLKNKKYLIVIDDVWTSKALDQINYGDTVFPDSNNGSRIILTTRYLQVAKHPDYTNHIHKLNVLDNEQSWELLRRKAFRFPNQVDESTLKELEILGEELAKKCKGLPLALSILGGFLSKNITNTDLWSKMVNSLDWEETNTGKNVVEILALSFHDLPHYLKPCFLYMACFPEDHLISTSNLTKMWIAEGFIPFSNKCSFEETARKYLTELAHRSMIQVVEISKTHGWIKRIRVHDILRDFCIAESEKIGFLKIWDNHGDLETSISDGISTYRVAFNKSFTNKIGKYMPNLRALIGFNLTQPSFRGLNYLRVLELVSISNINKLPDEIGEMIFLRYIGLRKCARVKIPSSIEKLINLQTFDARGTDICLVTGSIWKISTLRHVYMHYSSCEIIFPKHGELQNVQTFHCNLSPYYFNTERDIDNFTPKIREFIRTFEEKSGIFSFCLDGVMFPPGPLPVLSSHQNLQELGLGGVNPFNISILLTGRLEIRPLPNKELFPPNLRKLKLSCIHLEDDPMPILELLPSLVVLQLGEFAYMGNKMSCSAGGFLRLQHMSINFIPWLTEWKIETGSMPELSQLSLSICYRLKMQPGELAHLPALKELKLIGMRIFPKETCNKLLEKGCKVIIKND